MRNEDRVVLSQATTWIRFRKGEELVELAFNSRMLYVYNFSDKNKIVNAMITHETQQIENPVLMDSKFIFDEVVQIDIDFHQFNLTRSSYILASKKVIIYPQNDNLECFKWEVIAVMRWEEIGKDPQRISKLKNYEEDFNWIDIKFPAFVCDIANWESRNQISVNVLAVEDKQKGG